MKILHYTTSLNIGGTESFVYDIVSSTKDTYENHIVYIKKEGEIGRRLRKQGFEVNQASSFFKLIKYIKKYKPDIIHTYLYRANIAGRVAGRLCGVPVVSSRRSTDTWRKFHLVLLDMITSKFCAKIIVNSAAVSELLVKKEHVPSEKVELVYIGIPEDWFGGHVTENIKHAAGFVGRLHREKGADFLPEFAKEVMAKNSGIKIKIAGDGELKNCLKENLPDNCELAGWVRGAELKKFYDSVDMIFLLSRMESMPRVLAEAGARGVFAIAPDVGGVSEFIEHGQTGFLYSPLDISQAAELMVSLYNSPEKIKKIRRHVYKRAADYTKEKMIKEVSAIYNSINEGRI